MFRTKRKLSLTISTHTDHNTYLDRQYRWQFIKSLSQSSKATIQQGILLSSNNQALLAVKKQGKITTEAEIHRLINANPTAKTKAILQIITFHKDALYFPLMKAGDLLKQQNYLFTRLNDHKNPNIACLWLYKQLIALLDALVFLHTTTFRSKTISCTGISHNDIKPANILIDENGHMQLADFGCACPTGESNPMLGSLYYTAPEKLAYREIPEKNSFNKSDVWSLGITLYQLLHNKPPNLFTDATTLPISFLEDNINGLLVLKEWGETYATSLIAKKAKESLHLLENMIGGNLNNLNSFYILHHLSMAMLTPIEERPDANTLLEQMQALTAYFTCQQNEYDQFVLNLLNNSPLNQEGTPLQPRLSC